ncbi:MAG: glycosyltransferase, partial [Planctomycetes bacterium]|nr:glycosyltransferase [Planctomycetota bacterium]
QMSTNDNSTCPFVSVIIPVYNDEKRIGFCIEALLKQSYPRGRFEIIVVDNGSQDATQEVVSRYPVTLFVEKEVQGSYAARNKGIEGASGEILAFTDGDCVPQVKWIEAGVDALEQKQAELVGGRVRFPLARGSSAAEYYDALCNIRIKDNVETRGVAFTANLFVRKSVIENIGGFPHHIQSGGDVYFTSQATSAGHKLVYSGDAIVEHPARDLKSLVKKSLRIGRGKMSILDKAKRDQTMNRAMRPGRFLTDLNPMNLRRRLIEDEFRVGPIKFLGIVGVAYLVLFTMCVGAVIGLCQRGKFSRDKK